MTHKASPFAPNVVFLWSLSTSSKRLSLAKVITVTLTEEQNSLTTGREYKEECWRGEAKQLVGKEEKVDSSDFFPWPQYAVHNGLGQTYMKFVVV
jgi:hypothetical protein